MIDTIYIEEEVADHPRAIAMLERFPRADRIRCRRYGEVFNPRGQNFRLQKGRPALILAAKQGRKVLPTPPEYQIGADRNYYFSHMLNCLYDCRYCFLQGMYRSANYLLFVNYEAFEEEIEETVNSAESGERVCFFSGYDCDSLALEAITGFAAHFIPVFARHPSAWLELRTKSVQTSALEARAPLRNVIVSYTLTPDPIAREVEHGAPPLIKRLEKVRSLAEQGWMVGLRFDPLVPWPGYRRLYGAFFDEVFAQVPADAVHSATLGALRFPWEMYDRIARLYPEDRFLARFALRRRGGQAAFPPEREARLIDIVRGELARHLPGDRVFYQSPPEKA